MSYLNEHAASELVKEFIRPIREELNDAERRGYDTAIRDVVSVLMAVCDKSPTSSVQQKYISELTPEMVRYFTPKEEQ